jgi:ABC-2 type transport system permease protein
MTTITLLARQVRYENRAFWRNPEAAFFTFAFPLLFMIIMNTVFASSFGDLGGGLSALDFYTPAIIAFSIINASFTNLAITVAIARDDGLLKRIHGTPLPTTVYLAARVILAILLGLLLAAIVAGFGALLFDVRLPVDDLPALLLALGVGSASFAAMGLAAAGLIPSATSAAAIVNAITLPLLFISNVFINVQEGILVTISDLFPVRHFADALQAVYHPVWAGPLDPLDLAWVAGWGIAGLAVAARTFSWEPRP